MIPEAALLAQLETFRRFSYSLEAPSFPSSLPGVRVPMSPPKQTNCCAFVEGLIIPAAARWNPSLQWGLDRHKQMMIMGDDLFSPVAALVEAGLAAELDIDTPPGSWAVVQGWSEALTSGHTFIIARHDRETDLALSLEANSSWGLKGVGHRNVGMLNRWEDFDFDARLLESPWTWERFRGKYPKMAVCALFLA